MAGNQIFNDSSTISLLLHPTMNICNLDDDDDILKILDGIKLNTQLSLTPPSFLNSQNMLSKSSLNICFGEGKGPNIAKIMKAIQRKLMSKKKV